MIRRPLPPEMPPADPPADPARPDPIWADPAWSDRGPGAARPGETVPPRAAAGSGPVPNVASAVGPGPSRPGGFLRPEDLPVIAHHLRGVKMIEVRQIGGIDADGAEVVALLEAAGLQVSYRRVERMTPPPARRLVFRYPGAKAELTIAPEVDP